MEALVKKDISKLDDIKDLKELYELLIDNTKVGYCLLKDNKDDQVLLFIEEKYRSNGYGRLFFKKILDIINDDLYLKTNNSYMINIIESYNGKELSRNNGFRFYIIPKRG